MFSTMKYNKQKPLEFLSGIWPIALVAGISAPVNADFISTSASCGLGGTTTDSSTCDSNVSGAYGYVFTIDDGGDVTDKTFNAELFNSSIAGADNGPKIDEFAFNINAAMPGDFEITNISPNWTFVTTIGQGGQYSNVDFDYVGSADSPGEKLEPGESLTFDFVFKDSFVLPTNPFTLWTGTLEDSGGAFGGGDDSGQVAVSFQTLVNGDSDLLASNWGGGGNGGGGGGSGTNPIPGPLALLGIGVIGFVASQRRRRG